MARRRKNRTHKKLKQAGPAAPATISPKSFIIKSSRAHHTSSANHPTRSPHHSTSLNLLVKDFRKVMEPNTASHLRERKSNKFKDFLAMAGPLSVSHIIVFSQSDISAAKQAEIQPEQTEIISNLNLKIYKVPRGPTLTFKILRYSLMIDILNSDKHPRSPGAEFKTEPLLIMNNFNPEPNATSEDVNRLNLLTTTFRNLFPQIKVREIQLVQTRRVVLLSYNPTTRTIDFRHYLITVKPVGVSKALRKLIQGVSLPGVPTSNNEKPAKKNKRLVDLGSIEDVAEYLLGKKKGPASVASSGAFTGEQSEPTEDGDQSDCDGMSSEGEDESEGEGNDRKVDLPQNYLGRGNFKNTKKAIRLREIGPRMEWGLIKIEDGLGSGDVLYHELIKKSKGEDQKIKQKIKEKEKLKAQRRKQQEENVKKKAQENESKKRSTTKSSKEGQEEKTNGATDQNQEAVNDDDEMEVDEDQDEDEDASEIDEDAELSDIFSELAHSEDDDAGEDHDLDNDGSDSEPGSSSESESEIKPKPQTNNSNPNPKQRKKARFSL